MMLGLGRALGETIALALTLGAQFNISFDLIGIGGNTIAANIANKFGEAIQRRPRRADRVRPCAVRDHACRQCHRSGDHLSPARVRGECIMTTISADAPLTGRLQTRKLPPVAVAAIAVAAAVLSYLLFGTLKLLGGGWVVTVGAFVVLFLVGLGTVSAIVEGGRSARNRIATALIYSAFILALLPLFSVVFILISRGASRLSMEFFSAFDAQYHRLRLERWHLPRDHRNARAGGHRDRDHRSAGHRLRDLHRRVRTGRLATAIRFFVDVMTGMPSIVAGLFILAFWVYEVSPHFSPMAARAISGFAAALALSVLMLPVVTDRPRRCCGWFRQTLREGAYALGVPKWKTILRIVLPTALPGIITGVMLPIARAAGETAPVLLVAGGDRSDQHQPVQRQPGIVVALRLRPGRLGLEVRSPPCVGRGADAGSAGAGTHHRGQASGPTQQVEVGGMEEGPPVRIRDHDKFDAQSRMTPKPPHRPDEDHDHGQAHRSHRTSPRTTARSRRSSPSR